MIRTLLSLLILALILVAPSADAKGKDRNKVEDSPTHKSSDHASTSSSSSSSSSKSSTSNSSSSSVCASLPELRAAALERVPKCTPVLASSSDQIVIPKDTFSTKIKELERRAKTKEAKAAVAAYKKSVDDLLKLHRSLVEGEYSDYNKDVAAILGAQRAQFATTCSSLASKTSAAFDTAAARCGQGMDDSRIRAGLRADLAQAESAFVSTKAASVDDRIKRLRKERDDAVQASLARYMASTTDALAQLKRGLGR